MSKPEVSHKLDTKGLYCPEPVMMLHTKIDELSAGELLEVVATDPSTKRDIPKFCGFLGHELVEQCEKDANFYYLIKKG
ncbi:sulfurtransferase TusA [Alkalimarinus sediminis]|uniref:Sulfurtransferase TusA n=1 Tax=Alkalimarinus sediminis TaxID=1632866 RepID=A0A9E8HVB1_9ALTE|nr:sulfurtransferase TusA [Alkalimarinus sediminis]UZW76424.1 sulfurtransferase TusA [Alkalimarinus sediminis]